MISFPNVSYSFSVKLLDVNSISPLIPSPLLCQQKEKTVILHTINFGQIGEGDPRVSDEGGWLASELSSATVRDCDGVVEPTVAYG